MRTLIFDFDGTLADSFQDMMTVFCQISGRQQGFSAQEIEHLRKLPSRKVIKELGIPLWRAPKLVRRGMRSYQSRIPHMKVFAGLPEVLRELHARGDHLMILSSNTEENIDHFLHQHHLRHHFETLCCEAKLFGKAKALRKIMRTCGVDCGSTWYIGDETRDVAAAHKARVKAAAVSWGYNHESILQTSGADVLLHKPVEILDLV